MFKYNEKYLLSIDDKDIGNIKVYGIVDKKNIGLKKRIHKVKAKFKIINFLN